MHILFRIILTIPFSLLIHNVIYIRSVSKCHDDMEVLVADANRSIATLAITTLLKIGRSIMSKYVDVKKNKGLRIMSDRIESI